MKQALWMLLVALFLAGCATGRPETAQSQDAEPSLAQKVRESADELGRRQERMRLELQQQAARAIEIEPVLPVYDPLESHTVSFSMVDASIQSVLYALARAVGMNIIFDPAVKTGDQLLTLHFEEVSAARVLREILSSFDLYHLTRDGVIRIQPFQEQFFNLNFLNVETFSEFAVGGDVLGVGDTTAGGGLSGNVKLVGRTSGKNNVYDLLEDNIRSMKSPGGTYSLNRLSGTLFVKDTPAVIRSVARLVNHLTEMLDRQILIEARIIEVALSDEHRYGINWSALRSRAADFVDTTLLSWGSGQGLLFSHQQNEMAVEAIVEALDIYGDAHVISNPSIRSKHAQPAVISVGTSYTYQKSVRRTRTATTATEDITTEVEVSSVFDGLILGVIPFIEADGRISLLINPIQSEVDQESLQPRSVSGQNSADSISLPRVRIKEISTNISLRNSEVAILGGLIDKRRTNENKGVPGLSRVPLLNYLFKNQVRSEQARELVIILSVTIV